MKKILCMSLVLFLSACGQKGALYLPQKADPVPTDTTPVSADPNDF